MARVTKRVVEAASPSSSEYILWDDKLTGFGLRVYPNGKKTYVVQYRINGRTRRIALGGPDKVRVAQARERARELLSEAALGSDPAAKRAALRSAPTVAELAERFVRDVVSVKNKPRTLVAYTKILSNQIVPALGSRKVFDLRRSDIETFRNNLSSTPFIANRSLSVLSKMCSLAESWGFRPENTNPCRGVDRYKEPKRERFLTEEEFSRFGRALRVIESNHPQWSLIISAFRLIAFTGARRNEIISMQWDFIDWERLEIRLPDSKTGPKSIPLSAPAMQLLEAMRPTSRSSKWVFPAQTKNLPFSNVSTPWKAVCEEAGLANFRIHDLRHSYASVGGRSGLSLPLIGALLGQSQAATTERYSHFDSGPVHEASSRVGERIERWMSDHSKADVVRLGSATAK